MLSLHLNEAILLPNQLPNFPKIHKSFKNRTKLSNKSYIVAGGVVLDYFQLQNGAVLLKQFLNISLLNRPVKVRDKNVACGLFS